MLRYLFKKLFYFAIFPLIYHVKQTISSRNDFKQFQVKINQFPGLFSIGRKDSLWLGYMQMREKFGEEHFDFHAKTFVLPGDKGLLEKEGPIFCLNWDRNEKHDPIFSTNFFYMP